MWKLLRDAGIDVITTLNIQHLDSLQDVVTGITGVEVRETIPDRILEDADVQLVDLPTDALIERLQQGKVYPPHRAQQALQHFFRPGNLTALREMALRRTALGVEDALTDYMHEHRIEEIWPAGERVLVLVDADPAAGAVLRNAWRLGSALRGELVAVTVQMSGSDSQVSSEQRSGLDRNVLLAEDLGARIEIAVGRTTAEALASVAKQENASIVVIGHRPTSRWRQLTRPSLVDQLLRELEYVDVYVVERSN